MMNAEQVINDLQKYEASLAGILSRFKKSRDRVDIHDADDPIYRQQVTEIADLLSDALGPDAYTQRIIAEFNEGISNFSGSPSYRSVSNILGIVRAALTRFERNPDLLTRNTSGAHDQRNEAPGPAKSLTLSAETGVFNLTGSPVGFTAPRHLPAESGSVSATGPEGRVPVLRLNASETDKTSAVTRSSEETHKRVEIKALAQRLESNLAALDKAIVEREDEPDRRGIGGNNPPEPIRDTVSQTIWAVQVLRDEAEVDTPRSYTVQLVVSVLEEAKKKFHAWGIEMGVPFREGVASQSGKLIGGALTLAAVGTLLHVIGVDLTEIIDAAKAFVP